MRGLLKIDFVRFCIVGALGFLINTALLTLLYRVIGSPLLIAQLIAGEIALFSNFLFHHHWTYKANRVRKTMTTLIIQFHATSWVAVIGSALLVSFAGNVLHLNYLVALVLASGAAIFWNFGWSKYVIWRKQGDSKEDKTEEVSI
jgi:putative flippase GtrA